jgi:hypothetical protein
MPRINTVDSGHGYAPPSATDRPVSLVPFRPGFAPDDARLVVLRAAMTFIDRNVAHGLCGACDQAFLHLAQTPDSPPPRSFTDLWSDPNIWISQFRGDGGTLGVTHPNRRDIGLSMETFYHLHAPWRTRDYFGPHVEDWQLDPEQLQLRARADAMHGVVIRSPDEHLSQAEPRTGDWRKVAATLIHELAHVNGAVGGTLCLDGRYARDDQVSRACSAAEGVLRHCRFADLFDPDVRG